MFRKKGDKGKVGNLSLREPLMSNAENSENNELVPMDVDSYCVYKMAEILRNSDKLYDKYKGYHQKPADTKKMVNDDLCVLVLNAIDVIAAKTKKPDIELKCITIIEKTNRELASQVQEETKISEELLSKYKLELEEKRAQTPLPPLKRK